MTTTKDTLDIRRADERGRTRLGWLNAHHSFSFGAYHDPARMGFGPLRVINDDWIDPDSGFGEHPHHDMEILTWVLSGALRHADSTGGGGVIRPGELQAMTAGSGITHSEFNPSATERTHLLQIWIEPRERGLEPRYDQRVFPADGRRGNWQALANSDGRDGALPISQDASLFVTELAPGARIDRVIEAGRSAYVHVASGRVVLDGTTLAAGDAIAVTSPGRLTFEAIDETQLLLFELA